MPTPDEYLRTVPSGILCDFRDKVFSQDFIEENSSLFLTSNWAILLISKLESFIKEKGSAGDPFIITLSPPLSPLVQPRRVDPDAQRRIVVHATQSDPPIAIKQETDTDIGISGDTFNIGRNSSPVVKQEDASINILVAHRTSTGVRTHVTVDNGRENIEILDSDDNVARDEFAGDDVSDGGDASTLVASDWDMEMEDLTFDAESLYLDNDIEDLALDSDELLHNGARVPSRTVWIDPGLTSEVCDQTTSITCEVTVDRTEYLSEIPSYWPVPRIKTAYVMDLRDPKFDFCDAKGNLLAADALIKRKDQDSSKGPTGHGDSTPKLTIFTGQPIECYRSHLRCSGFTCYEAIDPSLVPTECFELGPASLETLIAAQIKSRITEASSANHFTLIFFFIIHDKVCDGVDSKGQPCTGTPILKTTSFTPFIGCSAWSPQWRSHRLLKIPSNVDNELLTQLFDGQGLPTAMQTCTRIVPAHIGSRMKLCTYPHQSDGQRSKMAHIDCPASRTIFVPVDPALRMVCIIPNIESPHNHPLLPATKTAHEVSRLYHECVKAHGVVGATVKSVENASTMKILMNGKTPSIFNPALHLTRKKQTMIHKDKLQQFPSGLGLSGVFDVCQKDVNKPLTEQYIHVIETTEAGGILVFTFVPFLLSLIHDTVSFQVDTTFKHTVGDLKEIEFTIWFAPVLRAVTIARVYSDRSTRKQYQAVFDGIQQLTLQHTGKPFCFKRLSEGGNLLTMGVDLEAAQVLGAGDSFLLTNQPAYSGIHTNDPEEIIQYFICACATHVSCGICDFQGLLTKDDYKRIKAVSHIKSEEALVEFEAWIQSLNIEKITNWWAHKKMHCWMLPTIIQSQSKIHHHNWTITDTSTNMNESQHKWSNGETRTQLALAEAIITARRVDERVASEILDALKTGVLQTSRNDILIRMGRSVTRAIKAGEKAWEAEEAKAAKEITNKKKKKGRQSVKNSAESSSSGRVPSAKSKAREAAFPYPPAVIWNQSAQLWSDDAAKAITPQLCADTSTPSNCFLAETFNPVTANVTAGAVEPNLPFPIDFHQPEALLPVASSLRVTLEMQTLYDSLTFEESIDNFLANFGPYDGTGI
ncbi:hypothetical protein BDN71DRAFT_1512533 [Pleurotus eryngii]|uniref:Uncharacterized protein n=1 Tax=Pleurotus eryngii TaxID=5323 RepID=A0A9P5ZJ47_PLEER|nr:hypothetical protein BDN71DRAFT_1512533 [Pleurotus eryngii]